MWPARGGRGRLPDSAQVPSYRHVERKSPQKLAKGHAVIIRWWYRGLRTGFSIILGQASVFSKIPEASDTRTLSPKF